MFRRKLVALMMVTVLAGTMAACGDKTVSSDVQAESTLAVESTTQAATTKSAEEIASEKASAEEASSRAEEIKASMAAEKSQAAAAADAAAASQAAAQEAANQAASAAAAAEVGNQVADTGDEVVTVATGRGTANARLQYTANYAVYVELVRLTNELRASLGVGPVTLDSSLSLAACSKACDYYFEDYYDGAEHTMVDGRVWTSLFSDFGIAWQEAAENIARGPAYKTAQQMFEGWKNSSVHYHNMINPLYNKIGIGTCGYVWVMDLKD